MTLKEQYVQWLNEAWFKRDDGKAEGERRRELTARMYELSGVIDKTDAQKKELTNVLNQLSGVKK